VQEEKLSLPCLLLKRLGLWLEEEEEEEEEEENHHRHGIRV
jgi:hypothetical protein